MITSKSFEQYPFSIRRQFLSFFSVLFSYPKSPYVQWKAYTDQYIAYHYLSFIKLYKSEYSDSETLELCRLTLLVLFRFSLVRTDDIVRKFYQLGCVNFLVREISLEHELSMKLEPKVEVFFTFSRNVWKIFLSTFFQGDSSVIVETDELDFKLTLKEMRELDSKQLGQITSRKTTRKKLSLLSSRSNSVTRTYVVTVIYCFDLHDF